MAVAAQIPLKDVFTVVATGVGSTMGKLALLIALGAILGRMIEVSGGVQSLAATSPPSSEPGGWPWPSLPSASSSPFRCSSKSA